MVELADTLRSERSPRNRVGVQLPLLALLEIVTNWKTIKRKYLLKFPILDIIKPLIREIHIA
jgi:hypothetical protein